MTNPNTTHDREGVYRTVLLHTAQDAVLRWRLIGLWAMRRHDQSAAANASRHVQWWAAQVERLASGTEASE